MHLIVWILEQPEGQGDTDMWIDNSVRDNAQKQEELRVIRGARIGGWHPVCDVCDAIAQKLDDIVVCQ